MYRRKKYYHKTIVLHTQGTKGVLVILACFLVCGIITVTFGEKLYSMCRYVLCRQVSLTFASVSPVTEKISFLEHLIRESVPNVYDTVSDEKRRMAQAGGVLPQTKPKDNAKAETNIVPKDLSAKTITFSNATDYSVSAQTLLSAEVSESEKKAVPTVLVMHTHTSEAYCEAENARSTDNEVNVVHIGKIIAEELRAAGIKTVHDITQNDVPAFNGSYKKALSNIEKQIQNDPAIACVLDVHRDYIAQNKNGKEVLLKGVATVEGIDYAQAMFVVGTDASGLYHPHWRKNLAFAVKVQNEVMQTVPGIMRSVNIRKERFNEHMTSASVIIEVGSAANTLAECENTAHVLGKAVAHVLQKEYSG